MNKVENIVLVNAGLKMMQQIGKPLTRLPSKGRAMLYELPNHETVRMRTCNDHVLIVVADRPSPDASLNIEGTDWLLIVMPEIPRTPGKMIGYFVPAKEAASEARRAHHEWLATNPNTKGDNKTWNLWFNMDAPDKTNNYAEIWSKYRLELAEAAAAVIAQTGNRSSTSSLKEEVEIARQRIAMAAGVSVDAVRICIDFGN